MRAAVLHSIPGRLAIEDVQVAEPGPNEVIVRTTAAGLCHSDLHVIDGKWDEPTPVVAGHESAGIVERVGTAVTYVEPGDHVVTCLSVFCGRCVFCLAGRPNLCDRLGVDRAHALPTRLSLDGGPCGQLFGLGSFAEQMLVHENATVKIRQDMPLELASLIGCGVLTGVGAVVRTARIEVGSTVAVVGCGGVGLNCIQGAILAGASRVIAIDVNPRKLALARVFGATDVVDASTSDPVDEVHQLLAVDGTAGDGSGGVDYSFEAIGLGTTAEQCFAMLKKGGVATIIGALPPGSVIQIPGPSLFDERRVQGSNMGSNRFREDVPRYIELYMQGRLKLDELVSARLDLANVNDGFEVMRDGDAARSIVVFESTTSTQLRPPARQGVKTIEGSDR